MEGPRYTTALNWRQDGVFLSVAAVRMASRVRFLQPDMACPEYSAGLEREMLAAAL